MHPAAAPDTDAFAARLRLVNQMAREMNNRELVGKIEAVAKELRLNGPEALTEAETRTRALETLVGIDPGGWSMHGLKIFHPTKELQQAMKPLGVELDSALALDDLKAVRKVIAEFALVMGDQAGTPDARRKGESARKISVSEAENVTIFFRALEGERKSIRLIREGTPLPDQMLRLYAGLVRSICEIRPAAQRHAVDKLPDLDAVLNGACCILMDRQQPDGLFPFPDLRGKNIRFGELTEHLVAQGGVEIKDGWMISADPTGGSQYDTSECGTALLLAGKLLNNPDWTKAGLKAADWALGQKCVVNFNYNAFSVSLLASAYLETREDKYWQAAWHKWTMGVAPGQTANGRWIDPHNARTVYHLIIVRAMNDLLAAMPASISSEDKKAFYQAVDSAVKVVIEEFARLGVTDKSFALRELIRFRELRPSIEPDLQAAIEQSAAVVYANCVQGDRAKFGASATELAILHRAAKP